MQQRIGWIFIFE